MHLQALLNELHISVRHEAGHESAVHQPMQINTATAAAAAVTAATAAATVAAAAAVTAAAAAVAAAAAAVANGSCCCLSAYAQHLAQRQRQRLRLLMHGRN